MKIALGQFAVRPDWQDNAAICLDLIARADAGGARLLVLPEGILARDIADPDLVRRAAQPLDGPFMTRMLEATRDRALTLVMTVHVPADQGKVWNIQVALRGGRIVAQYRKLHLYDAFSMQESVNVVPGDEVPPLLEVDGLRFGMMTCYDLRFPELARRLAVDGADALLVPAAWVKGPLKEHHWEVLATARALDNTCYVVAVGECGPQYRREHGGGSAGRGDRPRGRAGRCCAELDPRRLAQARQALPVLANRRFARPELA